MQEAPREPRGLAWGCQCSLQSRGQGHQHEAGGGVLSHLRRHETYKFFRRDGSREVTCLDKVFGLKNLSNFTHDDIIFRPSKSIKMNVLNNHLNVTREH